MSQSNLVFDPTTGLSAPDAAQIVANVENEWKNALGQDLNIDPSSPQGQLITSQAAMIANKNTELLKLANQFNPFTAQGIWQDALGYIYFLQRKVAQHTIVTCICRGLVGTVIPENSLVENTQGIRLKALTSATIPISEEIEIEFQSVEAGAIEIPAMSVDKIITVIPGWDTVENQIAGITGTLEESQYEFERRRYDSVAKNAHGTVAALYGEIANINEVVAVVVLENYTNQPKEEAGVTIEAHSVFVSVFGGADYQIANAMYNKLPAGCGTTGDDLITYVAIDYNNTPYSYYITRPEVKNFYFRVRIKLTDDTLADINSRVKANIIANFNGTESLENERVKMAQTVYASRFYASIIAAGVKELIEVTISLDGTTYTDFVYINANIFPNVSDDTIIIEEV